MEEKKLDKLPIDARLLSNAVIELNISRRNVSIYPIGHQIVRTSIDRSFENLAKLFELRKEVTLSLARDAVIIDEYLVDKKNPVLKDFALSIYNMGIASITFMNGLTKEELIAFLEMITQWNGGIHTEPGIREQFSEKHIQHIEISLIDYSAFQMVKDEAAKSDTSGKLWEEYIFGLIEGKLIREEDLERISEIPPADLANVINRAATVDPSQVDYDRVITSYLRKTSKNKAVSGTSFLNLMNLMNDLKPDLKKQFLSGTFQTLAMDPASTEEMLKSLPEEKLMDVLNEINKNEGQIPEPLTRLMEKFSALRKKTSHFPELSTAGDKSLLDDITLSPEISELFSEKKLEDYMPEDYKHAIDRIIRTEKSVSFNEMMPEIDEQIEDEYLEGYFNDRVLELIENGFLDAKEYGQFTENLMDTIQYMLETGRFREIIRIIDVLEAQKEKDIFKESSENVLFFVKSKFFIKKLLKEIKYWGKQKKAEVSNLCYRLKEHTISPLIEELIVEENASYRKFYLSILITLGEKVVDEAQKWLEDTRWYVIRNMLLLMRECGTEEQISAIKPYCRHENLRVRYEAMKALLDFKHPDADIFILENLESTNEKMKNMAIHLTGTYRRRSMIPVLTRLLNKKVIRGPDYYTKIQIVDALGKIGAPSAVKALTNLYEKKSLFFKNMLKQVKEEIFKSLIHYPYDSVRPLLKKGSRSGNEKIQKMCKNIMRGHQK